MPRFPWPVTNKKSKCEISFLVRAGWEWARGRDSYMPSGNEEEEGMAQLQAGDDAWKCSGQQRQREGL